jgi:hypothetical protein
LGEPFGTEPEALPVIHQQFERCTCSIPEDKDRPAEGLFSQLLAAHRRQAIDTFAKIDRLRSQAKSGFAE